MKRRRNLLSFLSILIVVSVLFGFASFAFTDHSRMFSVINDVKQDWAYDDIEFCVQTGIMSNTGSPRNFEPYKTLSRAEFVQIVRALASGVGRDVTFANTYQYTDVPESAWFFQAVQWATETTIASGVGGGAFHPNDLVSREQLALFMYNFITKYCNVSLDAYSGELPFSDTDSISSWAKHAVSVCCELGLLSGTGDGKFTPAKTATRAEAAAIAHRLLNYYNATPACFTGEALQLLWTEDFDGDSIDFDVWKYGSCGELSPFGDIGDLETYRQEHIKVEDGDLVMKIDYIDNYVLHASDSNPDYVGNQNSSIAWIDMKNRFSMPYGYYEVRCIPCQGSGVNSAFWMSCGDPWNPGSLGSKDGTEVDIFESTMTGSYAGGFTEKFESTVHWCHGNESLNGRVSNYFINPKQVTRDGLYLPVDLYDGDYHTFGVLWTEDKFSFYYDGYYIYSTDCSESNGVTDVAAYILLSCHFMEPDWYGLSKPEDFPTEFRVDYVKWYQLDQYMPQGEFSIFQE